MKKMLRNTLMMSLIFVFVLAGTLFVSADEALAADANVSYYVENYSGSQVKEYKELQKAPKPASEETKYQDWIFAGWYTDDDCSNALSSTVDQNATYYAKYVPSEVLSVKCQVTKGTTVDTDKSDMRLVSTVDSLQYKRVGFEVYFNGATTPVVVNTTKVYERIVANESGIGYDFSSKIFDVQSEYFVTATLKNISGTNFEKGFYIKPYWETLDGTMVYGVDRYARVEDSYLRIVNVPVRLYSDEQIDFGGFNVSYDAVNFEYIGEGYGDTKTPAFVSGNVFDDITVTQTNNEGVLNCSGDGVAVADGTFVHLRFKIKSEQGLPKQNKFKIQAISFINGENYVSLAISDVIYEYFQGGNSGVADVSWFDANKDSFVLTSLDEFLGFSSLSQNKSFANKTVFLAKDITMHTGDAASWSTTAPTTFNGAKWTPIGTTSDTTRFAGIFDGQGHTISGIYASGENNIGLFRRPTATAVLRDFKLENSHFIASKAANSNVFVGSVMAAGTGTIDSVYSNAHVTCLGRGAGGFVGALHIASTDTHIKNSWYDGVIHVNGGSYIGGFVGMLGYTGGVSSSMMLEDCLYTGDIKYGTSQEQIGRLVGYVLNSSQLIMKDVFASGKLTCSGTTTKTKIGNLIGEIPSTATAKVDDGRHVYVSEGTVEKIVGSGTISGTVTKISNANTYGLKAASALNGFAFCNDGTGYSEEGVWVARNNAVPTLKTFADTGIYYVPDVSWYDEPVRTESDGTKVYEIHNVEEFYGFTFLSYSNSFANEKIELKTDIIVNKGEAVDWATHKPKNNWIPIGWQKSAGTAFAGTFDGQGHVISGIYVAEDNNMGLFGKTTGTAVLKNFYLKNSYIASSEDKTGLTHIGAIVGSGAGTFDTIYTDAIVSTSGQEVGGFVGCANLTDNMYFNNCWFDGTVYMDGASYHGGGLVGTVGCNGSNKNVANVSVENYLYTGTIKYKAVGAKYTRVGGLFGATLNGSTIILKTSLIAGKVDNCGNTDGAISATVGIVGGSTVVNLSDGNDCYVTKDTNSKLVGADTSSKLKNSSYLHQIADKTTLYGSGAQTVASKLDYTNHWMTVSGSTPVLRRFEENTMWYNNVDTEFTINSEAEFYGFAKLSLSNNFAGKTVKLGSDITINEGNANEWKTKAPSKKWNPISYASGSGTPFAGTFDGQGHTISGIYVIGDNNLGLFGKVATTGKIANFKLVNSYIVSNANKTGNVFIGSIAGSGYGVFENVYSDAIVTSKGRGVGGFVGCLNVASSTSKINNCWFDGFVQNNGSGYHVGGFVGSVGHTDIAIDLEVNNSLFTGQVDFASSGQYARVGGVAGIVMSGSELKLSDSLILGTVTTNSPEKHHGSIAGYVSLTSSIVLDAQGDSYTTKETYQTLVGYRGNTVDANGEITAICTIMDEYIHNIDAHADFNGMRAYVHAQSFDFTNQWMLRENTYPIPMCFATDEDVRINDVACFEADGMFARDEFADFGGNTYLKTQTQTEKNFYETYVSNLVQCGFEKVYLNEEGWDNGAVSVTTLKKDNVFYTVTYTTKDKTTYVSLATNLALSEYLNQDFVKDNDETNSDVTLSMMQLEKAAGGNFIFQLKNDHFVVYDSGETRTDMDNMIAYMTELSNGKTPVVDAWIISHMHADHYGILHEICHDDEGNDVDVIEGIYVQGIYMNAPSRNVFEQTGDDYGKISNIQKAAKKFRTENGETSPKVYRLQTGQTYYFAGLVMEVMMTQEQVTGYTDLNDSSTWCMFTVGTGTIAEKIMMGADADKISMQKIMDIYSSDYLYTDVFVGIHHGINTWDTFTAYCKNNSICNGKAVDDVVLYSRKGNPTDGNSYSMDEFGAMLDATLCVLNNRNLLNAVNKGVNGATNLYYGQGTICLTFGTNGIISNIISK